MLDIDIDIDIDIQFDRQVKLGQFSVFIDLVVSSFSDLTQHPLGKFKNLEDSTQQLHSAAHSGVAINFCSNTLIS